MTHDTHVFASTCPICGGAQKTPNDDLCEFCDGEGYVPMYNGLCYHVPSNPDRFRDQYGNVIGDAGTRRSEAATSGSQYYPGSGFRRIINCVAAGHDLLCESGQ